MELKEKMYDVRALAEYISETKKAQKNKKSDELMFKCDFESLSLLIEHAPPESVPNPLKLIAREVQKHKEK
jgi:hypothetical protein